LEDIWKLKEHKKEPIMEKEDHTNKETTNKKEDLMLKENTTKTLTDKRDKKEDHNKTNSKTLHQPFSLEIFHGTLKRNKSKMFSQDSEIFRT